MATRIPIGQLLLLAGHIDPLQLDSALAYQRKCGCKIGDALVALRMLPERVVFQALARQHGVAFVEIGDRHVAPAMVQLLPERLIRSRRILPLGLRRAERRSSLFLATSEPQNLSVLDEVTFATGRAVRPVLAGERDLERAIMRHLDEFNRPIEVGRRFRLRQ